MDRHTANKALIAPLRAALYDFQDSTVRAALDAVLAPDAALRFCHPLGGSLGPDGYWRDILMPLATAFTFSISGEYFPLIAAWALAPNTRF